MMAILVTGGAGYIGSVTVESSCGRGASAVVVLDDLARGHRGAIDSDIPFYQGESGRSSAARGSDREGNMNSNRAFTSPALAYVGESVQDPAKYFENNVGTGNRAHGERS